MLTNFIQIPQRLFEKNDITNLEIIKKLKESTFTDEDGEKHQLEFQDGLIDLEIEQLKAAFLNNNIDSIFFKYSH